MPKWGIFNASLLLNDHGHPPFLFQNWSYHMTNVQWTKFEQKSIVTFIWEELPTAYLLESPLARFKKFHLLFYNYCVFARVQIKNASP